MAILQPLEIVEHDPYPTRPNLAKWFRSLWPFTIPMSAPAIVVSIRFFWVSVLGVPGSSGHVSDFGETFITISTNLLITALIVSLLIKLTVRIPTSKNDTDNDSVHLFWKNWVNAWFVMAILYGFRWAASIPCFDKSGNIVSINLSNKIALHPFSWTYSGAYASSLVGNLLMVIASFFFFATYEAVKFNQGDVGFNRQPVDESEARGCIRNAYSSKWIKMAWSFVGISALLLLATAASPTPISNDNPSSMKEISSQYGLIIPDLIATSTFSLCLMLLIGKLSSPVLRVPVSATIALIGYSVLQFGFMATDHIHEFSSYSPYLYAAAGLLKILFVLVVCWLIDTSSMLYYFQVTRALNRNLAKHWVAFDARESSAAKRTVNLNLKAACKAFAGAMSKERVFSAGTAVPDAEIDLLQGSSIEN